MFEQQITRILLDLVGSLSLEDVLKQLLENVVVLQKEMRQLSDGFPVIMKEGQSLANPCTLKRTDTTQQGDLTGHPFHGPDGQDLLWIRKGRRV